MDTWCNTCNCIMPVIHVHVTEIVVSGSISTQCPLCEKLISGNGVCGYCLSKNTREIARLKIILKR